MRPEFPFYYHRNVCNSIIIQKTAAKHQQNFNEICQKLCHHFSSSFFMLFYVWCFMLSIPFCHFYSYTFMLSWWNEHNNLFMAISQRRRLAIECGSYGGKYMCECQTMLWIKKYAQLHSHSFSALTMTAVDTIPDGSQLA